MEKTNLVHSIRLEYGDALFRVYDFRLRPSEEELVTRHSHRYYELHLALRGSYPYRVDGATVELSRGHLLIIPPDHPHDSADPRAPSYDFAALSLSLERGEGEAGYYDYFNQTLRGRALTPHPFPPSMEHRVSDLRQAFQMRGLRGGCYQKNAAGMLIFDLFDCLDGFSSGMPALTVAGDEDRLILLDALVNQADQSIEEIAAAIHYSPRHTARLIKQIYGCSLSELRKKP